MSKNITLIKFDRDVLKRLQEYGKQYYESKQQKQKQENVNHNAKLGVDALVTRLGITMDIDQAIKRACEEPTLLDALTWICVWEGERAIAQALNRYGSGMSGAGWDTTFRQCLKRVMQQYEEKP